MNKSRSGAKPIFNRDLADRNARLEAENAALRALLEAVRETADVPEPADWDAHADANRDARLRAADRIAVWLSGDPLGWGPVSGWSVARVEDRAGLFRAELPLVTYAVKQDA